MAMLAVVPMLLANAAEEAPLPAAATWVKLTPATTPGPRSGMAMAYDHVSGKVVLFGGSGANLAYFSDTWTFDGVTWTKLTPPSRPPARTAAGMTFDAAIGKLVMFGGFSNSNGYFGDTWIFDGATDTWKAANPALSPPAATTPSVFTDPLNGRADVYGGFNDDGYQSGTWQFNGITWLQLQPGSVPSARSAAVSGFDNITGKVVLFGGLANVSSHNTWTWDGVNWTKQAPALQPPPFYNGATAYDPGLRLLIAFGSGGTWAWTGSTWAPVHPGNPPPNRESLGMANDEAIGHVVMFGGQAGSNFYDDTWELQP
jgi:hypothetical protein